MVNDNMTVEIKIETLGDARDLRAACAVTHEESEEMDAWCDRIREDAVEMMEMDWGGDDLPM